MVRIIKKTFNTTVSVKEGASRSVLRGIIQYDTLNEVNIRLSDGSKAFDYTGYTNIVFKVLKADGTSYIDSEGENVIATSPVDGIVTVNLTGQATAAAGLCQSVIEIYSGDGKMTTARLNYEVFENLDVDEDVESTTEYPALQNLLADLSGIKADASVASGYTARSEAAAETAEMWARTAQDIAEGDYATRAELEAVAAGAAPAGYGLGEEELSVVDRTQVDSIRKAGWYIFYDSENEIEGFGSGFIECKGMNRYITGTCVQEFYASAYGIPVLKRYFAGVAWTPWEWMNPDMKLGVEYRTTERFLHKPVYTKIVEFGALPNGVVKVLGHGVANIDTITGFVAVAKVGNESSVANSMEGIGYCYATATNIVIAATADMSSWKNCYCHMKYTKTTDT